LPLGLAAAGKRKNQSPGFARGRGKAPASECGAAAACVDVTRPVSIYSLHPAKSVVLENFEHIAHSKK